MLTLQTLMYIERHSQTGRTIWNYATDTLTPSKGPDSVLNETEQSISTAEKCSPIQAGKESEHGKASTTEEQKSSFF